MHEDRQGELNAATDLLRGFRADRSRRDLLDASVREFRSLIAQLAPDDPVRPAALTNLSAAIGDLFREDGHRATTLAEGISFAEQSVALTARTDPWYASRINNLGALIRERYQQQGVVADLRRITADQIALLADGLAPPAHLAMIGNNAAQGLRELFEVTLERDYLRQAYRRHRAAVRLARKHAPGDLAMILQHAGITTRLWRTGAPGAQAAVALQDESLSLTDPAAVPWAARVGSLAWSWLALARTREGASDLAPVDRSLALFLDALNVLQPGSGQRPGILLGLAEARERRWELAGQEADLEAALSAFRDAFAEAPESSMISLLGSARSGARLAARAGRAAAATEFLELGYGVLEPILVRQVSRQDQRAWQVGSEQVVSMLAVARVAAGHAAEAAGIVDFTRARESWLLASAGRLRGAGQSPEERDRLDAWLAAGGPAGGIAIDQVLPRVLDRRGARELEELVTASGNDSPAASTDERTVAYLVPGEFGGAIVVVGARGEMASSLLPRLTTAAVARRQHRLRRAYDRRRSAPARFEAELAEVGRWLGSGVIRSLTRLAGPPEPDRPLVLVPCGPLADLPLLSAWEDGEDGGRTFPLLAGPVVIAASVRAGRPLPGPVPVFRSVAVVEPDSMVRLLGRAEAEILGRWGPVDLVVGTAPDQVMSRVSHAPIIHFCGHGTASRTDAVESAIHLADGDLSVGEILRSNLSGNPVVFLASCETAAPDPRLPDQTFGPPEAFLHAGAAAVVAPSLSVSLASAVLVSASFYPELASGATPSRALQRAQARLAHASRADLTTLLAGLTEDLERAGRPHAAMRQLVRSWRTATSDPLEPLPLSSWCLFATRI